ncbi:hypothetical protein Bca4012_026737 [Brassica carinata]
MDSRYTALEKGKQQMREENTKQILRIKAPSLDTSALIKDNELTIIGRLTNPSEQKMFCPQRANDVIIAKEHHGRDSKVEEPDNYYQEGTNGQVTGRNIRSNAIIVADAAKSEKNQGRAPIMQAINTHETQSFKERVPFGERISTKQTRNPPPAANPNQKANMSWREKPPRNDGGNYTSPPYAKSRSGIAKPFHKSGDLFPPRNEGWWKPKNVDEVEVTSKETPTSQEKDYGRRSPIPSENLNETANTLQIPTLEAIMEELNESTRLYVSHADPIEAAARRQRVLTGDALGETEERARAMLEAAREKLLSFKQTGDPNSNPVTPPPENEIFQMDQRGQALMVVSTPSETPEEDQRAIPHDEAKTTNEDQIEKEPSKLKSIIVSPNPNREGKNLNEKATIEGIEEEETLMNYQIRSRRRTVRRSASKNLRSTPNIIRGASSKKRRLSQIQNSPKLGKHTLVGNSSRGTSKAKGAREDTEGTRTSQIPPIRLIPASSKRKQDFQFRPTPAP